MSAYFEIFAIFTAVIIVVISYFKWSFKYWERKNVPSINPTVPFGNVKKLTLGQESFSDTYETLYNEFKRRGHRHGGVYMWTSPTYLPIDPELVRNVLTRDFQHFSDRGLYVNEKGDPLSANLLSLETEKWRALRIKLTPTFTSGKIKLMFPLVVQCSEAMVPAMEEYARRGEIIDIKEVCAKFTTDSIGSCAFGLECNSFKDPNSDFRKYGKRALSPTFLESVRDIFSISFQKAAKILNLNTLPKEVSEFFLNMALNTIDYRKKNVIARNDFVNLLMNINKDGEVMSPTQMASEIFLFFVAGFETSSSTMTFALYELSKNQNVQKQARDEILKVLGENEGKLTYQALHDMKYLSWVVDETLRLHPIIPFLKRVCVKEYHVPDTNVTLDVGTMVDIPVVGLHHDPEYFKEPKKFIPERFNEENKHKIKPFTYLPFGDGPRNCIGLRFGHMQTKIGLAVLLSKFEMMLNPKTADPLVIKPLEPIATAKGGIWLNAKKFVQ